MIDYAQETGRGGRAGERVASVVLVEHGKVERVMKQKSEDLDVQAMGLFLIGSGCRRGLMSSYLDGKQVDCNSIRAAGCDRCGDGTEAVLASQQETSTEWQAVEKLLDEIRTGCAVCCMLNDAGSEEWRNHGVMQCTVHLGTTGKEIDEFRRKIQDGGRSHSCRRCWVSQKYCATGQDIRNPCQWPNVVVPLVRAIAETEKGIEVIQQCGYAGEFGGDWREYAVWLGKRHRVQVWGTYFSNAMVVMIQILLFCTP
jgi:hypothetical protein